MLDVDAARVGAAEVADQLLERRRRLERVGLEDHDLHAPVHNGYCHPEMRGSWSIKAVVKAVALDLTYDDLDEVNEGSSAEGAFHEAIRPETSPERRDDLRRKLLVYCERDTEVMVRLVKHFEQA